MIHQDSQLRTLNVVGNVFALAVTITPEANLRGYGFWFGATRNETEQTSYQILRVASLQWKFFRLENFLIQLFAGVHITKNRGILYLITYHKYFRKGIFDAIISTSRSQ